MRQKSSTNERIRLRELEMLAKKSAGEYSKLIGHFFRYDLICIGFEKWRECLDCGHFKQVGDLFYHRSSNFKDLYCQKRSIDLAKEKGTFNPFYAEKIE